MPDIEYALKKWSPYHIPPDHDRYQRDRGNNHFTYGSGDTSFVLQGTGLGDLMIIRQFGRALHDYLVNKTDPELGDIVITTGASPPAFNPDKGDLNLYWWWSFGPKDDAPGEYLDFYLDEVSVEPFEPERGLGEKLSIGAQAVAHAFGRGVAGVVADRDGSVLEFELK